MVDVLGRADVLDDPVLHHRDAVAHRHRLFLVVRDVDGRDADPPLNLFDGEPHLDPQLGIQVAEGFVHQQDFRLDDEGPGQRDALLLSTGELVRHPVLQLVDLHETQEFERLGLDLVPRILPVLQAERDVALDRQVREDRIVLEHHADVALAGVDEIDPVVVEEEIPSLDRVESGDHAQQRRLSASGGAEEREEFALPDLQGKVRDDRLLAKAFDGIPDLDAHAHGSSLLVMPRMACGRCVHDSTGRGKTPSICFRNPRGTGLGEIPAGKSGNLLVQLGPEIGPLLLDRLLVV